MTDRKKTKYSQLQLPRNSPNGQLPQGYSHFPFVNAMQRVSKFSM